MPYPAERPRRLRRGEALRRMVAETRLDVAKLVYPMFVVEGGNIDEPIVSMPGQRRYSVDRLPAVIEEVAGLGIAGVILFGIPAQKDVQATGAWSDDGIVQQALRAAKQAAPQLLAIADTCLCEYTSHGHCGVLDADGSVLNDPTLELLAKTAVSQARAGADIIAPSDMMDGRVARLRAALDDAGCVDTPIMSYAAKFASGFYGPFRDAAESAPAFGDRRGYQMDPANRLEALREVRLDVAEGADIIMVKPAMPYLDVVREVRDAVEVPVAAYQVSGEYAMLKAAASNGWLDEERVVLESLTGIARAGAEIILTYFAPQAARWLA